MKTKKLITGFIAAVSGLLLSGCLTTEIETVHSQVHHYEYNRFFEKIDTCTTKAFRTNTDSVINVYFWWPNKIKQTKNMFLHTKTQQKCNAWNFLINGVLKVKSFQKWHIEVSVMISGKMTARTQATMQTME